MVSGKVLLVLLCITIGIDISFVSTQLEYHNVPQTIRLIADGDQVAYAVAGFFVMAAIKAILIGYFFKKVILVSAPEPVLAE